MDKARIFVSHSKKDADFVRRLVKTLEEAKLPVWFDEAQIALGSSIPQGVAKGIAQADYMLVVLSKESSQARWLNAELDAALMEKYSGKGIVIVPILIGNVENSDIPQLLRAIRYADFRGEFEDGMRELLRVFGQEVETVPISEGETPPENFGSCVKALSHLSIGALRRRISRQISPRILRRMWLEVTNEEMARATERLPLWVGLTDLIEWAREKKKMAELLEWVCDFERRQRRKWWIMAAIVVVLAILGLVKFDFVREDTIGVPATNGLRIGIPAAADFQDPNTRAKQGLVNLPPDSTLYFKSSEKTFEWTYDRLQKIENQLEKEDVEVDIRPVVAGWVNDSHENPEEFKKWLEKKHDEIFVFSGFGSNRRDVKDSEDFAAKLSMFVDGELLGIVKKHADEVKKKDGPDRILIPVSAKKTYSMWDTLARARRAFWKRLIGMQYIKYDREKKLGPYYEVEGNREDKMSGPPADGYPRGCLLAAIYSRGGADGELMVKEGEGNITPFFEPGHKIENRGWNTQRIRFIMNDNMTEDNGPGYCNVAIRIQGRATIASRIWWWLRQE